MIMAILFIATLGLSVITKATNIGGYRVSRKTGENRKPGTFTKDDPRINRKGRPRSFDKLRALAQAVACQPALDADGNPVVDPIDGHALSTVEAMLIQMSHDKKQRRLFFELAYGKVPDELVLHGDPNAAIPISFVDYRKDIIEDGGQEEGREA